MWKKLFFKNAAKLAAFAFILQACTPTSPKATVTDGSVSESKIEDGAVSSAKIANGSITAAKLATGINITAGTGTFSGTLGVTGATTLASTLAVTGATTLTGALAGAETYTLAKSDVTNYATVAGVYGIRNTLTAANTAASTELYFANAATARLTTSNPVAQMVGSYGGVYNAAAAGTGVVTLGVAQDAELKIDATGVITTGYLFHGKTTNTGGGTLTNYRGLYLEAPTGAVYGATRYGIYSDGAIYNYFAGRVGIGNATPTVELDITGAARITGAVTISGVITADGLGVDGTGQYVCIIAGTGVVSRSAAACAASDSRLKEEIEPVKNALAGLLKLSGVTFRWKDTKARGSQREIGLIAQEVQKAFPEAVQKNPNGFLSVNYNGLIGPLVEAVRELHAKWSNDHILIEQQVLKLGQLERKIEIENIALKMENKALKERLDKIEFALAQSAPAKSLKPASKRKLASVQ